MIYLYGYLGVGVALFAWVYLANLWKARRGERTQAGPLDRIRVAHTNLWDRALDEIVVPVLGFGWVVSCWPWCAYWKVKERIWGVDTPAPGDGPAYAVEPAHLLKRLAIDEVEARETVFDPLGAAPNLPFGHLNAAWRAFVDGRAEDDELWSFSADWRTVWGNMERRAGYVLVRASEPGEHFLTMWKDLPQEAGCGHSRCTVRIEGDTVIFEDFAGDATRTAPKLRFAFPRNHYELFCKAISEQSAQLSHRR